MFWDNFKNELRFYRLQHSYLEVNRNGLVFVFSIQVILHLGNSSFRKWKIISVTVKALLILSGWLILGNQKKI